MNAIAKKVATATTLTTATSLVSHCRSERSDSLPPVGSILARDTLLANLQAVLESHCERVRDKWPRQKMRYDLNAGRSVPDAEPPPAFDLRLDLTAYELATLIGFVEDAAPST
jgi:hypothetical protein